LEIGINTDSDSEYRYGWLRRGVAVGGDAPAPVPVHRATVFSCEWGMRSAKEVRGSGFIALVVLANDRLAACSDDGVGLLDADACAVAIKLAGTATHTTS